MKIELKSNELLRLKQAVNSQIISAEKELLLIRNSKEKDPDWDWEMVAQHEVDELRELMNKLKQY